MIAPVLSVKNLESGLVGKLAYDEIALAALYTIGPEVFYTASKGDIIGEMVSSNPVGDSISDKLVGDISDADTSKIDPTTKNIHFRFYPAGTSF